MRFPLTSLFKLFVLKIDLQVDDKTLNRQNVKFRTDIGTQAQAKKRAERFREKFATVHDFPKTQDSQ